MRQAIEMIGMYFPCQGKQRSCAENEQTQGAGVDLGFPSQRGRGENSQVGRVAPNSHTRLTLKTPGPDFIFSGEYFGVNCG